MNRPKKFLITIVLGTLLIIVLAIAVCSQTKAQGQIWNVGKTVSFWATGVKAVEVRVNKPDGDLFGRFIPEQDFSTEIWGSWDAGDWAKPEKTKFYLQDVSDDRPLTSDNTISVGVFK